MKSVLILEDVLETRIWLKQIVATAFPDSETRLAANIAEANQQLNERRFDLVIIDLGLPDGHGLSTLPLLRNTSPDALVVIATTAGDDASIVKALTAGVQGYLLKDHEAEVLVAQLQQVAHGIPALSPTVANRIMRHFQATASVQIDVSLTKREAQVLDLIGLGLRNAEVSKELGISENTVSGYIKDIYRKLGISSRAEAAVMAQRVRGS